MSRRFRLKSTSSAPSSIYFEVPVRDVKVGYVNFFGICGVACSAVLSTLMEAQEAKARIRAKPAEDFTIRVIAVLSVHPPY